MAEPGQVRAPARAVGGVADGGSRWTTAAAVWLETIRPSGPLPDLSTAQAGRVTRGKDRGVLGG